MASETHLSVERMTPKAKLLPAPPQKRNWTIRQVYHIYQRGSRLQKVFQTRAQLIAYLDRFDRLARRYRVRVHAFCLMSNHVHFVLEPLRKWGISQLMQHLQSQYARSVHQSMGVTGHLWRNHFSCRPIKSARQYRAAVLYVEQTPTIAGVARKAHLYEYSSAPAHCANQPIYTLRHRHRQANVKLYLTRWRKEFQATEDWPTQLRSPRDAAETAEIERILGTDRLRPQKQVELPTCRPLLKSQTATPGFEHPISHGWTRQ